MERFCLKWMFYVILLLETLILSKSTNVDEIIGDGTGTKAVGVAGEEPAYYGTDGVIIKEIRNHGMDDGVIMKEIINHGKNVLSDDTGNKERDVNDEKVDVVSDRTGYHGRVGERRACPEGYHTFDSSTERQCYYLHHANVTWPEAFSYCKTFGSHAAKVDIQEKHQFLINKAKVAQGPFPLPGFWMAASDAIIEGKWVWLEDSSNMTYAPWSPGNPHDVIGQDCAAMWRSDDYKFVDKPSSFILHPICEIDMYQSVNYP